MAGLHFDITGDNSNFIRKLQETESGINNTSKLIEKSGVSIEQMFERMKNAAAAFGISMGAKELVSNIARVRGEFQQLEVAFNTMLGSKEKADALMSQLVRTAAITPFDLQGVANGAKQLLAYGMAAENVNDMLMRLGDIAAGLSIPLGDLVYLYGTTMSQGQLFTQDLRQFMGRGIPLADELAKQFGVAKDKVGELVTAGKVGFPEVQKAIEAMTNEGSKFGGLMEAQSKTITGQISNIEDAIDTMFNDIGKANEGIINDALSGVSYLVENYEKVGREIMAVASAYGAYKAVLMSVAAYQGVVTNMTYATEIAELSKLIPAKEKSVNADIEAAVASGRLTQERAAEVAAIRVQIAALVAKAEAEQKSAIAAVASAQKEFDTAKQRFQVAQDAIDGMDEWIARAEDLGNAELANTYRIQLAEKSTELQSAAIQYNTAAKTLNEAKTKEKIATETAETLKTNVNTASTVANARATNILTIAKIKLASASKALGLSLLANPYVLAAVAIAGLTYGIYKLVTAESDTEKAIRETNDVLEAQKNHYEEVRNKANNLTSTLSNESKSIEERFLAYRQLQRLMPEVFRNMDWETAKRKTNTELIKLETDELLRQQRIGLKTKVVMSQQKVQKLENSIIRTTNAGGYTGALKEDLAAAKKELEIYQNELDDFEKAKEEVEKEESKPVTYNKKYWENKKKEAEDARNALDVSQKNSEEWNKYTKQIQEAQKQIDKYSVPSKRGTEAEKLRKETEKYNVLLDKQALEQQRSAEDLQMQVDEARIKAMDEGSAKTIAEMELNFEKEMQAIDRQKEDALRKKIENARAAWDANPENKGKSFDAAGIELSDSETKYFDELYKAAIANNEKTYTDLTDRYLSYTDQRLEIERKFNDDIALLQESRKRAMENSDADELAKIDRSIAKATADRGKELMKHDFDILKQSPEYIRAFEDLRNTSSETLNSLLEQLENAKQTAARTLNPEDLREYTTTIQEIMDELDARNPFQALVDRQKELAEAEKELAEAKSNLDKVNSGEKVVLGTKFNSETGKIDTIYLSATDALNKYNAAKDKHQQTNNKFIKAEKTAREKVDELADAIKGVGDAIGGQTGEIISLMGDVALFATGTIDGISKVAQTGANAISTVEKASVILGIISTAIQVLQKISELGNNKAFKQYEAYAEKVKELNALTDAVNEYRIAALKAQQAEANWFSTDNLQNLRDYKALHDKVAEAYDSKAHELQAIYQNESGGGWLTGAANWVMGNLSALSWWDKWKNIWGQGNYGEGQIEAINNLRIETRKKSRGFLGTGIGGKSQKTEDLVTWARNNGLGELFDNEGMIDKEVAQVIIDNYGNKLVGQTKETLEALITLKEKYDEYIEQLHEYVSSLYEPLVDNFVDSLWDWLDNGKDALDSFKDYASDTFRDIVSDMMRTIVLDKVVGSFSDDIAALYEEYAKGAINETELMKKVAEKTNGLVNNYEENIPILENIMEQVKGYLQSAGIDLKQNGSSSQESTKKGFAAASQDSIDELNGRFTALYIVNEEVKNTMLSMFATVNLISVSAGNSSAALEEIKNLMITSNAYLEDIAKYTKDILNKFSLKLDSIDQNIEKKL